MSPTLPGMPRRTAVGDHRAAANYRRVARMRRDLFHDLDPTHPRYAGTELARAFTDYVEAYEQRAAAHLAAAAEHHAHQAAVAALVASALAPRDERGRHRAEVATTLAPHTPRPDTPHTPRPDTPHTLRLSDSLTLAPAAPPARAGVPAAA